MLGSILTGIPVFCIIYYLLVPEDLFLRPHNMLGMPPKVLHYKLK